MFSLTFKSIKAKKVRFLLTAVAVVLGVAFMAGTLVLTDTIQKSYDDMAASVYKDTDAVVRSSHHLKNVDGKEERGTLPASTLATVRKVKGVAAAEPQITGVGIVVGHNGKLLDANPTRSIPIAFGWQTEPALNPMELVSGHAPRGPDEIVIDRASQKKGHFTLGEAVTVLTKVGPKQYALAGVATYGGADSAAGAQVVAFAPATAAKVLGTPDRYDAIVVLAENGVSQRSLVANIEAAVHGPQLETVTGVTADAQFRKEAGASLGFLTTFLLVFAIVALLVGSFVIYNTFSITVVQRSKETALLRAIGAKRKQVMRAVMFESLLTGVFASAIGVVLGIATASGLSAVLSGFGIDLPGNSMVVAPGSLIVSMIIGIVVTVVAAYVPARKASKVAPIEAMRATALDRSAASKKRAVFGTLVTLAGAAFMAMGLSGKSTGPVGLGALAVFFGVAILGPVIARPFARLIGAPLPAFRGMAGTIARENATRNPKRTSATASALMIGVGLVVFITVFASSARTSTSTAIDKAMKSDWIVETQYGMGGLSPTVTKTIDALPETGVVTPLRFTTVRSGVKAANAVDITAFDPTNIEHNVRLNMVQGDINRLGLHTVAIQAKEAKANLTKLGDKVTLTFAETGAQQFTVAAVYGTKEPLGTYVMSTGAFNANVSANVDDVVLVTNAKGVSMTEARSAINHVLKANPNATLRTKAEFQGAVAGQINQILNLVYVLLAMALLIALFGIANTLALSVFERTREFGLLRAVGMSRSQVRSSVRWESVLIAMLGTLLGGGIGLGFAAAIIKVSDGNGITQLAIPSGELAGVVLIAAVAAVAAAAMPARRAARLDVLKAIQSDNS
jgi:putative ABC transport system permease protein